MAQRKRKRRNYEEPNWSRPPADSFKLLVFGNKELLEEIDIGVSSCYTMGRSGSLCDIKVCHESVSRQHAILQHGTSGIHSAQKPLPIHIYDIGSTHGTRINNRLISAKSYIPLRVGDVIEFGSLPNRYVVTDPENYESLLAASGAYQPDIDGKEKAVSATHPTTINLSKLPQPSTIEELTKNPYERISSDITQTLSAKSGGIFQDESSSEEDDESPGLQRKGAKSIFESVAFVQEGQDRSCRGNSRELPLEIFNDDEPSSSQVQQSSPSPYISSSSDSVRNSMNYFGRWQKHTKGFGLKMLQKFGYVRGHGLGVKERRGILHPVIPVMCVPGASLDCIVDESIESDAKLDERSRKIARRLREIRRRMITGEKVDVVAEAENKQLQKIVAGQTASFEKINRIKYATDTKVFDALNQHTTRALHYTDASENVETEAQMLKRAEEEALGYRKNRDLVDLRRRLMRVRTERETWRQRLQTLSGQSREFEQTEGTQRQFQEHVKMATTDNLLQARQMYRYLSFQENTLTNRIESVDAKNVRKKRLKKIF
mmetsp:Transcript_24932/g.34644  ORF Transcript_24932/g.34644 Transcript_24932/m.34644 type:complete len:545 (+) Transcript_24932:96-1730(+)|eukprot:jgi/Bigna1/126192/aug1.2_g900